jgi:UDP-GlcNAc:undecaprenyl-phosphate/decaprenyl-phosphate GlcNAc-1-phosphate transferase
MIIIVESNIDNITCHSLDHCMLNQWFSMLDISQWFSVLCIFNLIGSYLLTSKIRSFALENDIVDDPKKKPDRKFQKLPIPLLGATGFVFLSTISMSVIWFINEFFLNINLNLNLKFSNLLGILISIIILMYLGYRDDKDDLKPKQLLIPILLSLFIAVTLGGLKIEVLSYPFQTLLPNNDIVHRGLAFLWLFFCLAATKFLDGMDGLVTTIGIIALLTIASVSLLPNVSQPLIAMFALVWVAGLIGFLPFNFPNAKLYLGEGGSEIIGFIIGVLSILSGAKVATTSTVIGWFILDIALVMGYRMLLGHSPFRGDRMHWHFRLVDLGLAKHQALSLTTLIVLFTAQLGLVFPTEYKIYVGVAQVCFLLLVFMSTIFFLQKRNLPDRRARALQ